MPETAVGIQFDDKGLCQLCRGYKIIKPRGQEALLKEIRNHLVKRSGHNCIVPLSGGRDSAYALYYAKKVLDLSPLTVHNDNNFVTDIAAKNLKNITRNMDVPLIRKISERSMSKRIVKEVLEMSAHFGSGFLLDHICYPCVYGYTAAVYNTARKEKIPLIIWGDSVWESAESYNKILRYSPREKWKRLLSFGLVSLLKYKYFCKRLKKEYGADSAAEVQDIHLFDYIEWNPNIIVDTINKEMEWSSNLESEINWRIDCSLVPLINYIGQKAWGVSKLEVGFSNMIRAHKMDREAALMQVIEMYDTYDYNYLEGFLKMIGVRPKYIDKIL